MRRLRDIRALLALPLAMSFIGCATPGVYQAEQLPRSLQAPQASNPKTVMLAKLARPAATGDRIEAGDVIHIEIAVGLGEGETIGFPLRVGDDGNARLPDAGEVDLGGSTFPEAESRVAGVLVERGLYRRPRVTITMKRRRKNRVMVVGAVKNPGVYQLPRGGSDLVSALVAAGSLADDADTKIEIRQPMRARRSLPRSAPIADRTTDSISPASHVLSAGQSKLIEVDLVSASAAAKPGVELNDGAVVMVPRRDPDPVQVIGLVRKPGRFAIPNGEDLTVLGAISLASGVSSSVADKVYVIRRTAKGPVVIEVSIERAKQLAAANLRLAPGDTVSVEQTAATIALDTVQMVTFGLGAAIF